MTVVIDRRFAGCDLCIQITWCAANYLLLVDTAVLQRPFAGDRVDEGALPVEPLEGVSGRASGEDVV